MRCDRILVTNLWNLKLITMIRSYSDLRQIDTFLERFRYLELRGQVGGSTFGFDRHMNQMFYSSKQWHDIRQEVILRDNACDLGVEDMDIYGRIYIHHMNPMTVDNIRDGDSSILDPEYLISTTHRTHNAIHYGDESQLPRKLIARRPGDTKLWPTERR